MAKFPFGDEFFSEVLGTTAGTVISKNIGGASVLSDEMKKRGGQLLTLLFGPGDLDEQVFCDAVFNCMRDKLKDQQGEYERLLGILFTRLEGIPSSRQDDFRNKVLQMRKIVSRTAVPQQKKQNQKAGGKQPEFKQTEEFVPNSNATSEVLIGIAQMDEPNWNRFVKIMNLDDPGLDFKARILEIKKERRKLQKQPPLSFRQRFNFFRLW